MTTTDEPTCARCDRPHGDVPCGTTHVPIRSTRPPQVQPIRPPSRSTDGRRHESGDRSDAGQRDRSAAQQQQ